MTIKERNNRNKGDLLLAFLANIFLCAAKFVVGIIFSNISLTADAVNNLSDAGNNTVSLVSAKIAEKPADKEHPFGHERMEYIASTIIGFVVIMLSVQLLIESANKIILNFKEPYLPRFDVTMIAVLSAAIIVKLLMYIFFKRDGKKYDMPMISAMAVDSIGDVLSSAAILASVLVGHFFSINLDGYMGVVVSVIIFIGGFKVLKETFNSLLGAAPTPEEVACIKSKLLSFDGILGIHDLVIHNYGPQKRFVTVHAEVDASMSVMTAHELADRIERDFMQNAHTVMLVHIDPIVTDDDYTDMIKAKIIKTLDQKIGEIEIHDFRVVYGKRNRVLFDYVLSYGNKMQPSEVESILNDCVDCTVDYCVTIDFK